MFIIYVLLRLTSIKQYRSFKMEPGVPVKPEKLISVDTETQVILTVPHSFCDLHNHERTCDLVAQEAAESLAHLLSFSSEIFLGNSPRSFLDLNRDESFNSSYRQDIRNTLSNSQGSFLASNGIIQSSPESNIYLLDIHSFPLLSTESNGKPYLTFDFAEVALVDHLTTTTDYVHRLANVLHQGGVRVLVAEGNEDNSILGEAREQGIPSILIEYLEDLSSDRIDYINILIDLWLQNENERRFV